MQVSNSLCIGELATMMNIVIHEKPFYIINHLPQDEQNLLSKLIACKQNECVKVLMSDKFTTLQKHHFVVTYKADDR